MAMDIELVVEKAGHQAVGFAGTAERALALADELRPDLVLMDICLRGHHDGVDAAVSDPGTFRHSLPYYQRTHRCADA